MKEKRYKKQERGITLIALIITIIVMLILVAATIQVTISGGIFEKAGEAVGKTKNSMEQENSIIDEIVSKMNNIDSKPNKPEIMEGMIPVEWNTEEKAWVKADVNTDNWYEYGTIQSTKRWAIAVTVKAEKRDSYKVGDTIGEEDILGMFVWIPRYAYKIPQENYHTSNAGIIDIKFLSKTSGIEDMIDGVEYNAETTKNFTEFPDGYVVHPAFSVDNGEDEKIELTGIWVAKFEASSSTTTDSNTNLGENYGSSKGKAYGSEVDGTSSTANPEVGNGKDEVTVRPNVTSWRYIDVKNMYIACTNMVKTNNIHGLNESETDSHLIKDTEWGAVAYLTQSRYGNPQGSDSSSGVWNNSYYEGDGSTDGKTLYYTTRTGMVGVSRDDSTVQTLVKQGEKTENDGVITITYKNPDDEGATETKTFYEYWTANGIKGSTTGTIYGIYDMSGGVWDHTSGYVDEPELKLDWVKYLQDDQKVPICHKTKYKPSDDPKNSTLNYKANNFVYGNGIWETNPESVYEYRLEWR